MRKHILKLVILLFLSQNFIYAQYILKNESDVKWYNSIHQEKMFVHHNTSLLFTGEYLYYKLYCINSSSNNLSNTSKIAYIELISEHGATVFKHKIKLEKGLGQGDFFVPTSVPSGNYKLLAYTHWMRNGKANHFFHSDISIINPYRGDQSAILSEGSKIEGVSNNEAQSNENAEKLSSANKKVINPEIFISPNSKLYHSRSKVSLLLKALNGINSFGNYSISVRKIDTISTPLMPTSISYELIFSSKRSKPKVINDEIFMPEFKGEMITGKIINKATNLPEINKNIVLSIINNESALDITKTNEDAVFYFHLNYNYNGNDAILQVLDDNPEKYKIMLNEHQSVNPKNLNYNQFKITSKMKNLILERSIYNQIQNGFFSIKPDTIKTIEPRAPFYGNHQDVYNLDDYIRFPTVDETVVEVIDHAWTKKDKDGKRVLVVRGREFDPYYESELLPLLIVDGVFIQNHEDIIEYNAKNVKSISVLRDEYYYGSNIYKGIINIETIKGEYYNTLNENYISNIELFKPRQKKNYFNQSYNKATEIESYGIPDFRQQLLWIPQLKLNNKGKTIEFFTSDNKGDYEISLEGFTSRGKPVSVKKIITVE